MSSDSQVIQYLNKVKLLLSQELILIQNEIETIEKEIEKDKENSNTVTKHTIHNEEMLKKLENQISDAEKELKLSFESSNSKTRSETVKRYRLYKNIKQFNEQIHSIMNQNIKNDSDNDNIGDKKTENEKHRLTLKKYKIDCQSIVDTIEANLEEPDQCDNTIKKEIQEEINTLINSYKPYQIDQLKALLPTST